MTDPKPASRRKPEPEERQADYEQSLRRLAGVVGKLLAKRWLEQQAPTIADPPCDDTVEVPAPSSFMPRMSVDDARHATQEMAATDNTY